MINYKRKKDLEKGNTELKRKVMKYTEMKTAERERERERERETPPGSSGGIKNRT